MMTPAANPSLWWSRQVLSACRAIDMRECAICPGHRNAPLLAALQASGVRLMPWPDERAAGFWALGRCLATARPVGVCCTSGSAVGHLLPALCEADAAGLPLLLLTADRPPELRGSGAPQTMPQAGIFADFCRDHLDCPPPSQALHDPTRIMRRMQACLAACRAPDPGPVHINIPLDDPLAPEPLPGFQPPPAVSLAVPSVAPARGRLPVLPSHPLRGLIVAGPGQPLPPEAVRRLQQTTGYPLLADAASGLRQADMPGLVTCFDLLPEAFLAGHPCELLIRLGAAPVARRSYAYCAAQSCPVIRFDQRPVHKDFLHASPQWLHPAQLSALLPHLPPAPASWSARWAEAENHVRHALMANLETVPWCEQQAVALALAALPHWPLVCGNSLPVRHVNQVLRHHAARIHANRGVNGIDGTLATAAGLADGDQVLVILGDVTCFHDATSMALLRRRCAQAIVLVLDNGGGRIFDQLPVGRHPDLLQLLHTPPAVDLQALAIACGLQATTVTDAPSCATALHQAAAGGHQVIIASGFQISAADAAQRLRYEAALPVSE